MFSRKNIILLVAFVAGLAIIINILSENMNSGDGEYISSTSEKIGYNDVREYLSRSDFSGQRADEYFKTGLVNRFTLKFFKYLQGQFRNMDYDSHLESVRKYLYSIMDTSEADEFLELYKKYVDYENRVAKAINSAGTMRSADDYLELLKKMKALQVEMFGNENADIIFGAMMKSQEYPIRRGGILNNNTMYAAEKEKMLKKLNSDMWGEDAAQVENSRKPYVAYNEALSLYSRDMSEMNDAERQNKISEIRKNIFTDDVVKRLENVDKQLADEKLRDEQYSRDYNSIMNNSELSDADKTEEINNLQSRTYGEGAESVRRIENLNKGKAEMLKKYKTN